MTIRTAFGITINPLTTSMYRVYDSYGNLVRAGFPTFKSAIEFKYTFGNSKWYIR